MSDSHPSRNQVADGLYRPAARSLYDLLLRPAVGAKLGGEICIVPDGMLWMLLV